MSRNLAGPGLSDLIGLVQADNVLSRSQVSGKRHALSVIAERAARAFGIDADRIQRKLEEREASGSTGFGDGVAMPHAFLPGLDSMHGVLLRLDRGLAFDAVDDAPVDLIFALFGPPSAGAAHLQALARVSRVLRQPQVRAALRRPRHVAQLRDLFASEPQPHAA